jgi:shikimate dehydrogenase
MQQQLYGLVGYPLGHSFSKQYFTEKFNREGLAYCAYELFPLADIAELPALLAAHPNLRGLNVTIPYKEKILPYVHRLSPIVEAVGATNTLQIRNGLLTAWNTDIIGFEQSLTPGLQSHHHRALVLGTGGASRAAQYAFQLVGRQPAPGQITYGQLDADCMASHTLVINCTPVGMSPNDTAYPTIPYEYIGTRHYLYDMVYKPAETVFMQKGLAQGALVKNGWDMLLIQAEASWKIWNEA